MICAVHNDRVAVGTCCNCGRNTCPECKVDIAGQVYCNNCVQVRLKTGLWPGQAAPAVSHASGMGAGTPVPPEVQGWNWGGFLLTWIWGIGNDVWISLLALLTVIPYIGWIAGLAMSIILGLRGNEWAWQHKKWDSVEHFKDTQRRWALWGLAALAAQIVLVIAVSVLIFSLIMIASTMGYNWREIIPWDF